MTGAEGVRNYFHLHHVPFKCSANKFCPCSVCSPPKMWQKSESGQRRSEGQIVSVILTHSHIPTAYLPQPEDNLDCSVGNIGVWRL